MRQKEQRWEFIKENKKVRKHAFDQEKRNKNQENDQEKTKKRQWSRKKERNNFLKINTRAMTNTAGSLSI